MEFDTIIVGAGSAGCVLAARLSEDPSRRVLLLEAGGSDRSMLIDIPLGWPRINQKRYFDWNYDSEPEPHLANRRVPLPRGRVLGGCSSINAMVYVRGNPRDYDRWAQHGARGWAWADVAPHFRRIEDWRGAPSEERGRGGPITVRRGAHHDVINERFLLAAGRHGLPWNDDYNDGEQLGYARMQQSIRDGRRCGPVRAYLRPALKRPNLRVEMNALVERVIVENGRATGVAYRLNGVSHAATARAEVILSAGAFGSPHILMLSGIGPAGVLARAGIEPKLDRPGVGANLQDHIQALTEFERLDEGAFMKHTRWDRAMLNGLLAYGFGVGPASDIPAAGIGFAKVDAGADVPQIQYHFRGVSRRTLPWFPGVAAKSPNQLGCSVFLLHPKSRGRVEIASPDPAAHPRIFENFLGDSDDRRTLREGVKLARNICRDAALDGFRGEEIFPGRHASSDKEIDALLTDVVTTAHHPVGTCRMGSDEGSVVDTELRVRGVHRLRVVDASVMPDLISGNTNAPTLMIAERAAEMISRS